jgi:hypothetical protein
VLPRHLLRMLLQIRNHIITRHIRYGQKYNPASHVHTFGSKQSLHRFKILPPSLLTDLKPNMSHHDPLVRLRNGLMCHQHKNHSVEADVDMSHDVKKSGASRRVS